MATRYETMHKKIMLEASKLFLKNGYTNTTIKQLEAATGYTNGSIMNNIRSKEELLCSIVDYVLEGQFSATAKFLDGITDDKILFYAAETTLQIYMAESSEKIRDIYANAYSLPKSSAIIQKTITAKLEDIFAETLPDLKTQDFYKLEIASGGIMRGFMTIPCDMWFTIEQKVDAFLLTTFRVYCVPEEKIKEAQEFVKQFDYPQIAENVVASMVRKLEELSD